MEWQNTQYTLSNNFTSCTYFFFRMFCYVCLEGSMYLIPFFWWWDLNWGRYSLLSFFATLQQRNSSELEDFSCPIAMTFIRISTYPPMYHRRDPQIHGSKATPKKSDLFGLKRIFHHPKPPGKKAARKKPVALNSIPSANELQLLWSRAI